MAYQLVNELLLCSEQFVRKLSQKMVGWLVGRLVGWFGWLVNLSVSWTVIGLASVGLETFKLSQK